MLHPTELFDDEWQTVQNTPVDGLGRHRKHNAKDRYTRETRACASLCSTTNGLPLQQIHGPVLCASPTVARLLHIIELRQTNMRERVQHIVRFRIASRTLSTLLVFMVMVLESRSLL